jgi:hypothetical protein
MTRSTTYAIAVALILAAIMIAAASVNYNSPAEAAALPFAVTPGNEIPVRATKGDRLDGRPDIRRIAGVTVVLRDFGRAIR